MKLLKVIKLIFIFLYFKLIKIKFIIAVFTTPSFYFAVFISTMLVLFVDLLLYLFKTRVLAGYNDHFKEIIKKKLYDRPEIFEMIN